MKLRLPFANSSSAATRSLTTRVVVDHAALEMPLAPQPLDHRQHRGTGQPRLLRDLEAKMRGLQAPMEKLSRQMTAMSREMNALGGKMTAATAEAEAKMRELLDRAVASGLAQIVR